MATNVDITLNALLLDESPPSSTPHSPFSLTSLSVEQSDSTDSDSSGPSNSCCTIPDFDCLFKKKHKKHEVKLKKDKNAPYGCLHSRMHLDSALEEAGIELVEEEHKGKDEQSQEVEGACQRLD